MVSWAIKDFGGRLPRTDSRNLQPHSAEQATNCDLSSGNIAGLPTPVGLQDFSALSPVPLRAYRLPDANGGPDAWLPLPSPYSSVCRSPLANDDLQRIYWTSPGQGALWNTYSRIIAGNTGPNAPYVLGTIQPPTDVATLSVSATGGTSSLPTVSRSYTWTYVNSYGEESAPNLPTAVVTGAPDADWFITNIPSLRPVIPGMNYPDVVSCNLYRTSTGTNTGAQFYFVANFTFPGGGTFTDTILDKDIVNNNPLISSAWVNPPAMLDGLTTLPGGMLVGFTGNTVHFCEPNRPHTWPAAYDQSRQYEIVALAVWQQSLVVLTQGFPATGSGNSPSNYVFTDVHVPEPCISRGSVITDLMGVYYASQNGIVMLNYFGMQNQTLSMVTKNIWVKEFQAANIIACRHRAQYLALIPTGGFIIDYTEQRLGMMNVSSLAGASAIWNDEYIGTTYVMAGGKVYEWDSPNSTPLICRWRSKQFYGPAPQSLGACQISSDPSIETATWTNDPLGTNDPTLSLPLGVAAICNIYAGPNGQHLTMTKILRKAREIFRIPSGFKSFDWQIEVVTCVPIHSIELASTMKELRNV